MFRSRKTGRDENHLEEGEKKRIKVKKIQTASTRDNRGGKQVWEKEGCN